MLSFSPVVGDGADPTPQPQASVPPPPLWSGGRGTFAGERGGGRVPIPTKGHTLWCSIYISTLWDWLSFRVLFLNVHSVPDVKTLISISMRFVKLVIFH